MASFVIEGGYKLSGSLTPQGAKNEALQVIAATLLTDQEVRISNIPNILDVNNLINLIQCMGVEVHMLAPGEYSFRAASIDLDFVRSEQFQAKSRALRGSILLVGPLVSRFGFAIFPKPGGDKIGRRRLDTHFTGIATLGARCTYNEEKHCYEIYGDNLKGAYMLLDEASVTGTANVVMTAVLTPGETTIFNAACEPYLQQLCKMLNTMGAKISGVGSNLLHIEGVSSLRGTTHRLLPDMIEVGSFIGMAAMTHSALTLKDVSIPNLGIIPSAFRRLGITIEERGDDLFIPEHDGYEIDTYMDGSILTIADAPWPGLTPDLLSRLFFVDKLIDMGAQIILCDPHRATVIGLGGRVALRPAQMVSPDIRAGIALLIAAMSAEGTSRIDRIDQIDRGYERIDLRLNNLGAHISRIGA